MRKSNGFRVWFGRLHLEHKHILCSRIRKERIGNIISDDGVKESVVDIEKEGQFLLAKQLGRIVGQQLEELGLVLALARHVVLSIKWRQFQFLFSTRPAAGARIVGHHTIVHTHKKKKTKPLRQQSLHSLCGDMVLWCAPAQL